MVRRNKDPSHVKVRCTRSEPVSEVSESRIFLGKRTSIREEWSYVPTVRCAACSQRADLSVARFSLCRDCARLVAEVAADASLHRGSLEDVWSLPIADAGADLEALRAAMAARLSSSATIPRLRLAETYLTMQLWTDVLREASAVAKLTADETERTEALALLLTDPGLLPDPAAERLWRAVRARKRRLPL